MRGLPKTGYLSTSAALVGSDLLSPGLTSIHALRTLFHREVGGLLSLVAANSQLISCVVGPSPWTESMTWLALCFRSSFQGLLLSSSPLMKSFANRASDWVFGSIIPSPSCEIGRRRVSHLTFALALLAFPLHMKFFTTPRIWEHILGFGFHGCEEDLVCQQDPPR